MKIETKDISIKIPAHKTGGFNFIWEDGFIIKTSITDEGSFYIKANSAGLISLARHLLALAQKELSEQYHFHLDEHTALEDGSVEMIIEKDDNLE